MQAERGCGALLPCMSPVGVLATPSLGWRWGRGLSSGQKGFAGAGVGFPACPASVSRSGFACARCSSCSSPRHCWLACKMDVCAVGRARRILPWPA